MKRKIFNFVITSLAVIGILTIIGSVGTADYMVEIGQDYPMSETMKTMLIGVLMVLPAVVREVN